MKESYDAVVVGCGAGGSATAWRLCSKGLRVLLLDAGPRFQPKRDYPLNRPDWERHLFPSPPGSRGAFSIDTLDRLHKEHDDLRSWNRVGGRLVRGDHRQPFGPGYWHVQGIGGSTLHFVGEAHRLHPDALRLHSRSGVGIDWPLRYAELEPYYVLCEQLIGVAGPSHTSARWRSAPYPLPAHPFSPASRHLIQAGKRLGMHWEANARAALSRPYDGRPPCNYCGNCSRGCPLGDKGSSDVTFVRKAEATGRLMLLPNAHLVAIEQGNNAQIRKIEYIHDGVRRQQETPILILAAGAVQTPAILLTQGIGNGSRQVGRNFMETLSWQSTGLIEGLHNSHVGLPQDAICWDYNAPHAIPGVAGGCRFGSATQELNLTGPIAYATQIVSGFGSHFKERLRQTFGSALSISGTGEFLTNEHTYIDLDPTEKDPYGRPVPRLHSHLDEQDIARLRFMAETCRKLLKETGAEIVAESGSLDQFSATHVFGTCRMGQDSQRSVVDANCRSHDHPNLFITDASVFPSSGGGEAPSLTIQALATRAADVVAGDEPLPPSQEPIPDSGHHHTS